MAGAACAAIGGRSLTFTPLGRAIRNERSRPTASKLARKWSWQIALNVMLVAGIFIAAVFFGETTRVFGELAFHSAGSTQPFG